MGQIVGRALVQLGSVGGQFSDASADVFRSIVDACARLPFFPPFYSFLLLFRFVRMNGSPTTF